MKKSHIFIMTFVLATTTPTIVLSYQLNSQKKVYESSKLDFETQSKKQKSQYDVLLKEKLRVEEEKKLLDLQKQEIEKKYQEQIDLSRKQIESLVKNIAALETSVKRLSDRAEEKKKIATTTSNPIAGSVFRATAYDLSYESCGKWKGHPQYGMTSTGKRATYKRTIAVDPRVIPLGSKVKITFPEKWSYLNGVFVAEDTGGAVKGNTIDVFLGDNAKKTVDAFGVQKISVERL